MARTPHLLASRVIAVDPYRLHDNVAPGLTDEHMTGLVAKWAEEFTRYLVHVLKNRMGVTVDDADDTLQQTWLKALCLLRSGRGPQNPAAARWWLLRVAINVLKDNRDRRDREAKRRRRRAEAGMSQNLFDPSDEQAAMINERRIAALPAAIRALPMELREIAERLLEGWPTSQIAEELAINPGTVRKKLGRIRRHLRSQLEELGDAVVPSIQRREDASRSS